jgi:peptide deformylase
VILPIIKYGHPALREKGRPVDRITPEVRQLAADMLETMRAANGVGLAAQQIGKAILLTVIDVTGSDVPSEILIDGKPQELAKFMPLVLVNPELSNSRGEQIGVEGCLSVPEISADIRRAATVSVRAQKLDGRQLTFDCTGLLARAVQHEMDHLNGILFIDRMDAATRASFSGKLKRMQRETLASLSKIPKPRREVVQL